MVGGDSICDVLHQNRLTSLRLGNDQCALTLTNRGEEIDDAGREISGLRITAKRVLLIGEERCEMLEGHAVSDGRRLAAVDFLDTCQREVFLAVVWRTHGALQHVASLQAITLDLVGRHVDIIGRRKIVVIAGTQETIAVGHNLEYTVCIDQVVEIVLGLILEVVVALEHIFRSHVTHGNTALASSVGMS